MQIKTQEKRKLFDFIYNFSEVAKKEKWVPRYDIESDSFSFSVSKIPNDARLKYFDNEIAFYITRNNDIKGLFIEYFKSNFIQHNKDMKKVISDIYKEKEDKTLIELDRAKVNKVIPKLEEIMQTSLAEKVTLT